MIKKTLVKHFNNITFKKDSRPLLQGIHFNAEDQTATVTDSHRLLRIHDSTINQTFTLNPNTLEFLSGNYPDVTRLFPATHDVTFDPAGFTKAHVSMFRALKEQTIKHTFTSDIWTIETETGQTLATITLFNNYENQTMYMNAKYFTHFLDFLVSVNQSRTVHITFTTPVRPLYFNTNEFDYLITPLRMNK